jgi:hypothetical protein
MTEERIKEIEEELDAIGYDRRQLATRVAALIVKTTALRSELTKLKYGLEVGVVVRAGGRWEGQLCMVREVDDRSDGRPWVVGSPARADGSFGTARRNLFGNWEVV